jgi:hypothetical protein
MFIGQLGMLSTLKIFTNKSTTKKDIKGKVILEDISIG